MHGAINTQIKGSSETPSDLQKPTYNNITGWDKFKNFLEGGINWAKDKVNKITGGLSDRVIGKDGINIISDQSYRDPHDASKMLSPNQGGKFSWAA